MTLAGRRASRCLKQVPRSFAVKATGRGTAEVWINGKLAHALNHQGSRFDDLQLTIQPVWPESGVMLRPGENVIAVRAVAKGMKPDVNINLVELTSK